MTDRKRKRRGLSGDAMFSPNAPNMDAGFVKEARGGFGLSRKKKRR